MRAKIDTVDYGHLVTEEGMIARVESRVLWIATQKNSVCGACAAKNACGQGILARIGEGDVMQVQVERPLSSEHRFTVGDKVVIGVEPQALVLGSLMVYVIPLMLMLIGAYIGSVMFDPNGGAVVVSVLGFCLGALACYRYSRLRANDCRYQPVLVSF